MMDAVGKLEPSETFLSEEEDIEFDGTDLIGVSHVCTICGQEFRLSKLLFEHQVSEHRQQKISTFINSLIAAEDYYSSDSDCDYTISVEVLKTQKSKQEFDENVEATEKMAKTLNDVKMNSASTLIPGPVQGGTNNEFVVEVSGSDQHQENDKMDSIAFVTTVDTDLEDINFEVHVEKLTCHYCPQTFTNAKNLKQHVKMYHIQESGVVELDYANMDKFVCPECMKELRDLRCLKKHLKLCHNLIVEGLQYNSAHKSQSSREPAIVKNDLSDTFPIIRDRSPDSGKSRTKCGICGHGPVYGYTTILKHQIRRHGRPFKENNEIHTCGHCGKEFGNKENLSRHLKSHENARRYRCDLCPARFNTNILLRRHKNLHVYIKCGICDQEFQFRRQYKTHHRTEHPTMPKKVQMIQETTNNEIVITNDIPKVNQIEFSETCMYCARVFRSKRGFKDHVCKANQSNLTCDVDDCGFVALDSVNLLDHRATEHSLSPNEVLKAGKKDIQRSSEVCETCNKSFKSRKGFQQHKCKSVRIMQCPCENCGHEVGSLGEYFKHVEETHHGVDAGQPISVVSPDLQVKHGDFNADMEIEVVESEIVIS